ncbi:hypothetical protein [uncultured Christiangramia sp.]|uniref:hypothetical protein n=1 Tax=Christiangramia sp. 3-2217-3z TaxID=3417564 RepID=UPI00260AE3C6|nr:hypothetical protein [uncultured Christiangramia sp.]
MSNLSKSISLRPTLLGESVTLLATEKMECLITQEGLVELINQLVNYKEEGKDLFPKIYIFDDKDNVMKSLPSSQECFIGSGEKTKETMLRALKKCAPLTDSDWSIFIHRKDTSFDYGVFRAGTSILSVSIEESLIDKDNKDEDDIKAILIHQISDKLIEVKGIQSDPLLISFGGREESKVSPVGNQIKFIEYITADVPEDIKEPTKNFYKKIFNEILKIGHGTLACVINSRKTNVPKKLEDGIQLQKRIDVPKMIKQLLKGNDLQSNSELNGFYSIIIGMLQSDGITVFTTNGEIASYNVFIKHPAKIAKTNTSGGARSRTFLALSNLIGKGLEAAYIQSQDGKIEIKGNE